jgi:hypothetical protein
LAEVPHQSVFAIGASGTTTVGPKLISIANSIAAVTIGYARIAFRTTTVNTYFVAIHQLVSTSRTSGTEITTTVEFGFSTIEQVVVAEISARSVALATTVYTCFVAIAYSIPAFIACRALATTVNVGFTECLLPNTIYAVVTLWAVWSAAVFEEFSIVENAIVTVWWNLVVFVQAARQKGRGTER